MSYTNLSIWASLPRTQRGQPIVLGVDPKGKKLLYGHGNSVIIRDIEDPAIADVYTEHSIQVNVAQYAPSGFYICSGDQHGKVRIWDTINPEHILKAEYQPLGGPIRDICWSQDSQRICVVGEGRGKFAHVFMMDTGASVKGDLSGHTKAINSVSWKPTRPFRIATGSEDSKSAFFEGPPFVFKCTKSDHTKFVQSVRYSPNGERFATGGFDGKIFIYNGTNAELDKELGDPAHKGGIYAVSWSPDSKQLLSASGDKSCRLWDVETGDVVAEFTMGTELEDQQMSCIWAGNYLISVSLSGFINYLDPANPTKPKRIIKGHNKPITRVALSSDCSSLYTTAVDGTVTVWDVATGENDRIGGKGHGNHVSGLVVKDNVVYTAGIDDSIKVIDPVERVYTGVSISLGSQPKMIAALADDIIAVTTKEICIIHNDKKVGSLPIDWDGLCVSASTDGNNEVAVGGADNLIHVYTLSGSTLTQKTTLEHLGPVTDLSYSPDNRFLVACDANRKVVVYSLPSYEKFNKIEWGFHNARINTVAWSPDSQLVASGALDTMIIIWNINHPNKHIIIKNSHPQSQVTGLAWMDNRKLVSVGHDGIVKSWSVQF
ncbi:actin-interacting protein 1 isoform X2 [Procambarus clarkii]|uniref:actin-interacting protein 1 isoform X2 n=1 Tax=Procambarus clarkii TaxID=6728 RepID=UPI001E678289|nr:actin-interacting protein 1-like isoform X2 [Procambarus clarkii]